MPYSLYVIELSRDVLDVARFRKRNPDRRDDKPCVYVGQTAHTPEERFEQHKAGLKCNKLARDYGIRLRPKLVANRGPYETRDEALAAEEALANRLSERGYGVWVG